MWEEVKVMWLMDRTGYLWDGEQGSVSPCRGKHVSCPTLVYITDGPLREGHIEVYPHREQGDLCQNSILWKIETASTLVVNKVGYYFKNMIQ